MMRITEVSKTTGATPDEIRYFERKGFIKAKRKRLKKREVRVYSSSEVHKVKLIIKYARQGFKLDAAFEKAQEELRNPRLV